MASCTCAWICTWCVELFFRRWSWNLSDKQCHHPSANSTYASLLQAHATLSGCRDVVDSCRKCAEDFGSRFQRHTLLCPQEAFTELVGEEEGCIMGSSSLSWGIAETKWYSHYRTCRKQATWHGSEEESLQRNGKRNNVIEKSGPRSTLDLRWLQ